MKKVKIYDCLYVVLDFIRFCFIVFIVLLLVNTFIIRNKVVSGSSMYPTLKDQERLWINVAASYCTEIKRFDVVVAKYASNGQLWIKRVIGLPNETIQYKDDCLYVNGKKVEEPFLDQAYIQSVKEEQLLTKFTQDTKEIVLKDDEYFLVGDNRIASLDSRDEHVGAFSRSAIISKGGVVYYPFQEMRFIGNGRK